jgi:hypothetical protein
MAASAALRRYNIAVLFCSAGYALALFGGKTYLQNHPGAHHATAYAAAVAPALPVLAMFFVIGRYLVEETDEYLRMLMVRQTLVASGLALSLATVWGFLESSDLAPHVDSYWIVVVWFGGLGLGDCINRLIERRAA